MFLRSTIKKLNLEYFETTIPFSRKYQEYFLLNRLTRRLTNPLQRRRFTSPHPVVDSPPLYLLLHRRPLPNPVAALKSPGIDPIAKAAALRALNFAAAAALIVSVSGCS